MHLIPNGHEFKIQPESENHKSPVLMSQKIINGVKPTDFEQQGPALERIKVRPNATDQFLKVWKFVFHSLPNIQQSVQ